MKGFADCFVFSKGESRREVVLESGEHFWGGADGYLQEAHYMNWSNLSTQTDSDGILQSFSVKNFIVSNSKIYFIISKKLANFINLK